MKSSLYWVQKNAHRYLRPVKKISKKPRGDPTHFWSQEPRISEVKNAFLCYSAWEISLSLFKAVFYSCSIRSWRTPECRGERNFPLVSFWAPHLWYQIQEMQEFLTHAKALRVLYQSTGIRSIVSNSLANFAKFGPLLRPWVRVHAFRISRSPSPDCFSYLLDIALVLHRLQI